MNLRVSASVERANALPLKADKKQVHVIRDLELDEVSAVDNPANPLSVMALWKKAETKVQGEDDMNVEELTKRLEDTETKVEALTKSVDAEKARAD